MQAKMAAEFGPRLVDDDAAVLAVLEPGQLAAARGKRFGRRELTAGTQAVMWALRIYAVLMLVVVIYQVVLVVRGG